MVKEVFDLPDGSEIVLARAEAFLRDKIEQLGGELYKKLEALGYNEYPCFEAQFYLIEPDGIDQDSQEEGYELAELYTHLDAIKDEYSQIFAAYL